MHWKNQSVAVRAAEARLDRGYGLRCKGWKSVDRMAPKHTVIRVDFVTPPKRDEHYSVSQRPSLIGYSEAK
jgi:hypothetical protein